MTDLVEKWKLAARRDDLSDSYLVTARPSPGQARLVCRLIEHFGEIGLAHINQSALETAYTAILQPDAAPSTQRRNVLVPLQAILNHAAKQDWCSRHG